MSLAARGTALLAAGMLAGLGLAAGAAQAQSIRDQVALVRDGQVRMSFAAKEGVCGNGRNISMSRHSDDWESDCEHGPVRVAIDIEDREIVDVDTYVGGRWRARDDAVDLGDVPPQEASDYLLWLASTLDSDAGEDAIFPAMIGEGVVAWPQVLEIAKDRSLPRDTRKSATFWLSQAAGDAAVEGLVDLAQDENGDFEVRKSAVFALSQLEDNAGVPTLISVARSNADPIIRKNAIFWLGQSDDPRAIALFEELLTQP
jgi:HEAT repeat protein